MNADLKSYDLLLTVFSTLISVISLW